MLTDMLNNNSISDICCHPKSIKESTDDKKKKTGALLKCHKEYAMLCLRIPVSLIKQFDTFRQRLKERIYAAFYRPMNWQNISKIYILLEGTTSS